MLNAEPEKWRTVPAPTPPVAPIPRVKGPTVATEALTTPEKAWAVNPNEPLANVVGGGR